MRQYVIGLDPGKNCGFAVYDRRSKKLTELKTLSFWQTIEELDSWVADAGLQGFEVFIEDVEAVSPTFRKKGVANQYALNKVSQNVGANKRDCQLLKERMTGLGIKFTPVDPRQKMAKMDAEIFQRYTGWNESSSQHSRDAAIICYNR